MNSYKKNDRTTKDGQYTISSSQINRLNKELKYLKDEYDGLKIKQLTRHGVEQDPGKLKTEESTLKSLRGSIKANEQSILEIKLDLKHTP